MKLGIVVTDERQAANVAALMREALAREWSVRCFLTDDGVAMIEDENFMALARDEKVHLSVCEHSVERYCAGFDLEAVQDALVVGGQYQDAELVRNSEQVLVF